MTSSDNPPRVELPEFEFTGNRKSMGVDYGTYLLPGGAAVSLMVSKPGADAIARIPGFPELLRSLGQQLAQTSSNPADFDAYAHALGLQDLAPNTHETNEGQLFRGQGSLNEVVIKQFYDQGSDLQFYVMNWLYELLAAHTKPSDTLQLTAPMQYAALMNHAGKGIILMQYLSGSDLFTQLLDAEEAFDQELAAHLRQMIGEARARLYEIVGDTGLMLIRDLGRRGINLFLLDPANQSPSSTSTVAVIDQPKTNAPELRDYTRRAMARVELEQLIADAIERLARVEDAQTNGE